MNAASLMRALPSKVRVGPFDLNLVIAPNHADYHGRFFSSTLTIELENAPANGFMAVDTLLHELGHAIRWAFHLKPHHGEEHLVTLTATAWTQIFRDNPWLTPWINKGLGHA